MAAISQYKNANIDDIFNPIFVAVVSGSTTGRTSVDPTTAWATATTLPSAATWNSVCYGNKQIVAVAGGPSTSAASSHDGATWVARTLPASRVWQSICYGNGYFVTVSNGTVDTARSTDGCIWNALAGGNMPSAAAWYSVTYGNPNGTPTFVAVSTSSSTAAAYSTDNGASWNASTLPAAGDWHSVCYGNGIFVAVAYNSAISATSTDGQTWSVTTGTMPSNANWSSVTYGNNLFVAIAWQTNIAATSTDGVNWTARTLSATVNWKCIIYGTTTNQNINVFVAIADSTTAISVSYDGITWFAKTITAGGYSYACWAPMAWNSGDTLNIYNNATITVNTNQTKFWKTITGYYGKLEIKNTSTSNAINFYMGRTNAATVNAILPQSGFFNTVISGAFIEIAETGDGSSGQTFTMPYTEYIPSIWVETGNSTGVYEIWNNVSGTYGPYMKMLGKDGLEFCGNGKRGNYFVQTPSSTPTAILSLTSGVTTNRSYYVTCTSTSGVYPGALITGTNISANSVVNRVVDGTTLELSIITTADGTGITFTIYNPIQSQFTSTIVVGDGTNGNVIPNGAKVKIPNIMVSDASSVRLLGADSRLDGSIVLGTAAPLDARICLFGNFYCNFSQASSLYLRNVAFAYKFLLSECYAVDIDGMGTAATPTYWYYNGTKWLIRDQRYGNAASAPSGYTAATTNSVTAISFVHNAIIKNWHNVVYSSGYLTGTGITHSVDLSYTNDATWENIRLVQLNAARAIFNLALTAQVYRNTFTNLELYGSNPILLSYSFTNTFNTVEYSLEMDNKIRSFITGYRISEDPENSLALLTNNTKYYFKVRSFRSWVDRNDYFESNEYSCTPFSGGWAFPDYLSVRPTESTAASVTIDWVRRAPESGTILYEIYRDTTEGFTARNASNRVYGSATAGTVTYADTTVSAGTRYYYRFRKYHFLNAFANTTALSGSTTLTAIGATNFDVAYAYTGFTFNNNSTILENRVATSLLSSMYYPGATITGNGIQAGTTIVSIDNTGREMIISQPTTKSSAVTLTTATRALAANQATITTSTDHGLLFGDIITVSGMADATYNGTFSITAIVSSTKFSYFLTHADEGETADNGGTVYLTSVRIIMPVQVGMGLNQANIPVGTTVVSVESNVSLTMSNATTGPITNATTNLQTFTESPEFTCVPNGYPTKKNFCLQSQALTNATWTKSNATVAAASYQSPSDPTWATNTACPITATSAGGTVTQNVTGLTQSTQYTASIYVRADQSETIPNGVAGSLTWGSTTTNFTATNEWKKYSATDTTGAGVTSLNFVITITNNGQILWATDAIVNVGDTAFAPITTTTSSVTNNGATPLTTLYAWCRYAGFTGSTQNQGIQITLGTAVTGTYYNEIYMSSTQGFTPSTTNCVASTFAVDSAHLSLTGSVGNQFIGITKLAGGGGASAAFGMIYLATASNANIFSQIDMDATYCTNTVSSIALLTASSDNVFHDIDFGRIRNYVAANGPLSASATINYNGIYGTRVQNIRADNYDLPASLQMLTSRIKGIASARAAPATTTTTYNLGGTSDGMAYLNTAVYGSQFSEFYFSATEGALFLSLEDTQGSAKPYTIIAGTPIFANTGNIIFANAMSVISANRARSSNIATIETAQAHKLIVGDEVIIAGMGGTGYNGTQTVATVPDTLHFTYINTGDAESETADTAGSITVGDSVEYEWPHLIKGVSGFRKLWPKLFSVAMGNRVDSADALKIEYAINTGSGYSAYTRLTPTNISAETVSATTGFYIKLKLTAMPFMAYGSQTYSFIPGEKIRGVSSGATAIVAEDFDDGTTGTIILSKISGSFIPSELIVEDVTSRARATNVATNGFAIGPSFTSTVSAIQIYTNVDQTAKYDALIVTVTLQNIVPGSVYYIYNTDTQAQIATGTASGTPIGDETTIDYPVSVAYTEETNITVNVRKSTASVKYLPYETGSTITSSGATVFIAQVIDTVVINSYNSDVGTNWTVDETLKTIKHTSGTTIYSVKELYSYLLDYFDNAGYLDDEVPIAASTPTEYNLINGWFIDDPSFQFLSGGAVSTLEWTHPTNSTGIRILTLDATDGLTSGDIGKVVAGATTGDTGKLLAYDTTLNKLWIRCDAANDLFDNATEDINVDGTLCGAMTALSVTGENVWSNIFTLGSLVPNTTLDVYQNDTQINPWWTTGGGHIDILVKVKEAGTEIDNGNLTILARTYGSLYDHFVIDASNGRNPVPLAAFADGNNQTAYATVAAYAGITFSFGYALMDLYNGSGPQPYDCIVECNNHTITEVYEYLKYATCSGSSISLNGIDGEFYTGVGDVRFAFDNEATNSFIENEQITGTEGAKGYSVSIIDNGDTGYITLRNVHGTFTDNMTITGITSNATAQVNGTVSTITPQKQAPFGTLAGGRFFGATGIFLEHLATTNANNYQLIDSTGTPQNPPTSINISISGLEIGDVVSVFKTTGDNKIIDKTYLTSHSSANTSGSNTFTTVENIPTDTPSSGVIRIIDTSENLEHRYSYTSYSGKVFSGITKLFAPNTAGLIQDYAADDTAYVPFIDETATSTSASVSVNFAGNCYIYSIVRHKGIIPFDTKGQVISTGYSLSAIRTTDSIVAP